MIARATCLVAWPPSLPRSFSVAKKIVAVRCEQINISGPIARNKLKWAAYRHLSCNTNPRRGPFHYRSPRSFLYRAVKRMVPRKTTRGALAMKNFKTFEGIPLAFHKVKRVVVPQALRILRLRPDRKYTILTDLCTQIGWSNRAAVEREEAERKLAGARYHNKSKVVHGAEKAAQRLVTKESKELKDAEKKLTGNAFKPMKEIKAKVRAAHKVHVEKYNAEKAAADARAKAREAKKAAAAKGGKGKGKAPAKGGKKN